MGISNLLNLIKETILFDFHDLLAGLCGIIVTFSLYHWVNLKLSKKIRSVFRRRTTIAIMAYTIFVIYGLIWEHNNHKALLIAIFYSFFFFNLYYFISCGRKLKSNGSSVIDFLIMFFAFWLFLLSFDLILKLSVFSNPGLSLNENLIGNTHLTEQIRIHAFKRNIVSSTLVALMATGVDFGCRYFISLQQFRSKLKELENAKLKEQLAQAQLDALHSKINPHFLYNALNSIAGLALTDAYKTRDMAVALSKFFRYSINKEQNNLTAVQEEFSMVETYLQIEKVRFEENLNYEFSIQKGLERAKIPRFIIQPLVENSVKHGLKGNCTKINICIFAQLMDNKLELTVRDDGFPFADDMKPGYGLKSVYDKLDLLFPGKYELALYNTPIKQVRILIDTTPC
jgi:sensor histidine kinase YesM